MFSEFIETAKSTTLPTYHYPDKLDAVIALLSLSLYHDYRLFSKCKGYSYYIGTDLDIPSRQNVINAAIELFEKQEDESVFYAHEIILRIDTEYFSDIEDALSKFIQRTDRSIFDSKYRPQWFHIMSLAVDSGSDKLFSVISDIVMPWWFHKIIDDTFDTVAGATKRQLIEHFSKMKCHIKIAEYKQKQEVCILPSNMNKVTYWDAILLSLGGSKEFSVEIANKLWKIRKNHYPAKHWNGSLRLFSWNYRGLLFLSEKDALHKNVPILSNSDVVPVINNKPIVSSDTRYDLLLFSWSSELIFRLFSEYLCYDPDSRHRPMVEIKNYAERFNIEIRSLDYSDELGRYLFRELQRCLSFRPQILKESKELKSACEYVLEHLHIFLDNEKIITPHPERAKTFVSTILSKNKAAATDWLLDYCVSKRPNPEYWINKCNTKKQVSKILSHLNINPYDAIPLADEKHSALIMELICDD